MAERASSTSWLMSIPATLTGGGVARVTAVTGVDGCPPESASISS